MASLNFSYRLLSRRWGEQEGMPFTSEMSSIPPPPQTQAGTPPAAGEHEETTRPFPHCAPRGDLPPPPRRPPAGGLRCRGSPCRADPASSRGRRKDSAGQGRLRRERASSDSRLDPARFGGLPPRRRPGHSPQRCPLNPPHPALRPQPPPPPGRSPLGHRLNRRRGPPLPLGVTGVRASPAAPPALSGCRRGCLSTSLSAAKRAEAEASARRGDAKPGSARPFPRGPR